MASKIYIWKSFSVTSIILIFYLAHSCCEQQVKNSNVLCTLDDDCWENSNNGKTLSRKKRALTFPEGSSLQLVYDQTIPIVAAQLLFTVGVTCALAFELPSEPIYHITQKLRNNLYGVKDDDEEATTVPSESSSSDQHSRFDYDYKRLNYINKQNLYDSVNKHNYYYSTNNQYHNKPLSPNYSFNDKSDNYYNNYKADNKNKSDKYSNQQYQSSVYATPLNQTKNVWTSAIKSFVNKLGQKVLTKKMKKFNGKKKLGNIFLRKHNRVYPVFGKRSVDDHLSHEDIFYMEHHRTTRFSLYNKIEGFLKGRGKNGRACILRALCETGQKNQNEEKAPFLLEILRAVFSLPHQVQPYLNISHEHFDDAHAELDDCGKIYRECSDSIWSSEFRF